MRMRWSARWRSSGERSRRLSSRGSVLPPSLPSPLSPTCGQLTTPQDSETLTYNNFFWLVFSSPSTLAELGASSQLEVHLPPPTPDPPGGIPLTALHGLLHPTPGISFLNPSQNANQPGAPHLELESGTSLKLQRHTEEIFSPLRPWRTAGRRPDRGRSRTQALDLFRGFALWPGFAEVQTEGMKAAAEAHKREAERLGWDTTYVFAQKGTGEIGETERVRGVGEQAKALEMAELGHQQLELEREEKEREREREERRRLERKVDPAALGTFVPPEERLSGREKKALAARLARVQGVKQLEEAGDVAREEKGKGKREKVEEERRRMELKKRELEERIREARERTVGKKKGKAGGQPQTVTAAASTEPVQSTAVPEAPEPTPSPAPPPGPAKPDVQAEAAAPSPAPETQRSQQADVPLIEASKAGEKAREEEDAGVGKRLLGWFAGRKK
ncbi:hypothetical protein CALVIDRAFT_136379 [Calocera viscosa TUFC12733]|uniref:Uncharacterized protein n=1 Tax=Calocera viscosa (strain TUFC12733) TaxID=1330018 RepID=A0A167LYA8_CALVF|nr:hypothetical protein CALVIDRAFT_136379 [Calocera viscosa TUFC12733]